MGNFDFGSDGGANWSGVAGYAKFQIAPKAAVVPRFEFLSDGDGFMTGVSQKLKEFTTTLELKAADNLLWRIEYRGDFSNQDVFTSDSGSAKSSQHSISFGLLYSFSTSRRRRQSGAGAATRCKLHMTSGCCLVGDYRPMSDADAGSLEPSDGPRSPARQLEEARRELCGDILLGQGGRAALIRYSERLDGCSVTPGRGAADRAVGRGGRDRRLRPAAVVLSTRTSICWCSSAAASVPPKSSCSASSFTRSGISASSSATRSVRSTSSRGSRSTTPSSSWRWSMPAGRRRPRAFARFESAFHRAGTHAHVVGALNTLIDDRYALFNSTLYQLEPDVKEAPGALRDLTAMRWIAALTNPSLLRRGPEDHARLDEAEDFLLRVRSILHFESKRNHNTLSHPLQEKAADILGYPGAFPQQRVERLMSDYFRHARIVMRGLEWVRKTAPMPVGLNLGQTGDGIRFIDVRQAAVQPATWLAAFQAAIDNKCAVSDSALACIRQHAERFRVEDFFPTPVHRAALLRFLKPRQGLYARLSEMHDCGVLGRMFPPFQAITCRVVRDFFHKYTVDEHTLLTIKNLERLATRASTDRERFSSLLQDLEASELLVLSLLFHDVGKWRDEDHASESVRMAKEMFERLGLAPEARATVEFLIANHLAMSQVAFRRDTEDPEIVRTFAALVGVEERLKMLCLMTLADVEAVSLETLTPWRAELLWRLFVDTYNHLTLGYGDELIEPNLPPDTELLANRPPDLSESDITHFLAGLPRRYLQLFEREAIYRHVRLSRNIHPDEVHLWLEQKGGVLGADRRHPRQTVSVFEHFGRAVVVRHGHPARPRDDQPERPRPRRVPVHRPGTLPRAQRQRTGTDVQGARRGRLGTGERHRPPAGPGGEPVPSPPPSGDPGRALRQSIIPPVYDSRYHCRRCAGPALPHQPGHLTERLRNRPRAHCHGGPPGHRRVSYHEGRTEADRRGTAELAAHLQRMLEGSYEAH